MKMNKETKKKVINQINVYRSVLILIVICIFASILSDSFLSIANLFNVIKQITVAGIVGCGMTFVILTGGIDLSVGSIVGLSGAIAAGIMASTGNAVLAVLAALGIGILCGAANGFFVAQCDIPPFIATLGTMFVARGVAYMVNGNRNTDAIATGVGKETADAFQNFFYYGKIFGVYNTFWLAIIVFVIFFFVLSKTRTGRHIYAIGSNVDAAKLSGVNVVSTTIKTYLISAVCSCLVGLILCAQAGMGNMEAGNMYEMYGVAAGVIGGVSPLGGTGILLGTLAGSAVWQTLENGLNMIGAQVGIQRVVIGVIVVVAVLLDVVVRNGQFGKRKK